eukprot:s2114_g10.t1
MLLAMAEKDVREGRAHLPCSEKFHTRRQELLNKKPGKELAIDASSLVVKEKASDLTCPTSTELEGTFKSVCIRCCVQIDKHCHAHVRKVDNPFKKDATGKTPIEKEIACILNHSSVSFHRLPLAKGPAPKATAQPKPAQPDNQRKRSRTPPRARTQPKGKGGAKGKSTKSKRGRGPNVPEQLIGKFLQTKEDKRIGWAYNLPNECNKASPGGACDRGLRVCAEPGCQKPRSMQSHAGS